MHCVGKKRLLSRRPSNLDSHASWQRAWLSHFLAWCLDMLGGDILEQYRQGTFVPFLSPAHQMNRELFLKQILSRRKSTWRATQTSSLWINKSELQGPLPSVPVSSCWLRHSQKCWQYTSAVYSIFLEIGLGLGLVQFSLFGSLSSSVICFRYKH